MIEDFKWISTTLAFVVPGFVVAQVVSLFVPRRKEDEKAQLLRYFVLTLGNFALFALLSAWPFLWSSPQRSLSGWGMATYFLLLPLLLGLILGVTSRANWVGRALSKLGFLTVSALPSAWDYKFGNLIKGSYMIVTLKDGTRFATEFGEESFAGDADAKDLYLQKTYNIGDDGEWNAEPGSGGLWLRGDEILSVEFKVSA